MEDYRKQAKIEALNKAFPGMSCGNPRCEELCAEAYDAAKSMRLDPADAVRRTIERELPCMSVTQNTAHSCRFGFMPPLESVALGREEKKQEREKTIIHVFRTGVNECEKCQKLDGIRISPEDWADEERMKKKGFWKQKNGEYLPHPHCKCHWEEMTKEKNNEFIQKRDMLKSALLENHTVTKQQAKQLSDEVAQVSEVNHHVRNKKKFLLFNGEYLMSSDGKLLLPAVAGKPVKTDVKVKNTDVPGKVKYETAKIFDYSKDRQSVTNQGGLPEGTYGMNPEETGSLFRGSVVKHLRRRSAWGNYHWRLFPTADTDMLGRRKNSFTIHGGDDLASAGCIDVGSEDKKLREYLQSLKDHFIFVVVKYPNKLVSISF